MCFAMVFLSRLRFGVIDKKAKMIEREGCETTFLSLIPFRGDGKVGVRCDWRGENYNS